MPFGDRTGPMGLRPGSGGRRGRCAWPIEQDSRFCAGFGRSWGGGWRRGPMLEERGSAQDKAYLQAQLHELEEHLAAIKSQIADLDKK